MSKSSNRRRRGGRSGMYSARILGAVADALDLGEGVLADKTAKRFFNTGHASDHSKTAVFAEFGRVMVELGLVPA